MLKCCSVFFLLGSVAAFGAAPSPGDTPGAKPVHNDTSRVARWLVNQALWGVMSTKSLHLNGVAFGNPISICDAFADGTPYFYSSMQDTSQQDLAVDDRFTLSLSEAAVDCETLSLDPEDPRCVRVSLSGKMVNVTDKDEAAKARAALFAQHPTMKRWPADHNWLVQKMQVEKIWVISFFGGAADVPLQEYAAATPPAGRLIANTTRREPVIPKPLFLRKAKTARWLAHAALWAGLATTSQHLPGYTFANPISVSDGGNKSTGIPYMYVSDLDASMQDLKSSPNCTLTFSEASVDCIELRLDPEDPRCVRLSVSGSISAVSQDDPDEWAYAKDALFSTHPQMAFWPKSHDFHFVRMDIKQIWLIDFFGGAANIPLDDYFKADPLEFGGESAHTPALVV